MLTKKDLDDVKGVVGNLKQTVEKAITKASEDPKYADSKKKLEKISSLVDKLKTLIGEKTWSEVDWDSDLSDVSIGEVIDPVELDNRFDYAQLVNAGLSLAVNNWIWKYVVAGKKMAELVRKNIGEETLEHTTPLVEVSRKDFPENEIWLASMREDKNNFNPPTDKDTIAIVKVIVAE